MDQNQPAEPKPIPANTLTKDELLAIAAKAKARSDANRPKPTLNVVKPDIAPPTGYVPCPGGCGGEYTKLRDSGLCWDCEDKSMAEQERHKRLRERMEKVLGPKGLEEFTFVKFRPVSGTEEALQAAQAFDPEDKELGNLYLHGPCGTGKSHIGYSIARKFLEAGHDVAIYKPTDIMRLCRMKEADEEERQIKKMAKHEVLLIDDLGVGRATEFSNQTIYEILDRRIMNYRNGLIITSNLSLKEFAEKVIDDRLPSRIAGLCRTVKIDSNADFRLRR